MVELGTCSDFAHSAQNDPFMEMRQRQGLYMLSREEATKIAASPSVGICHHVPAPRADMVTGGGRVKTTGLSQGLCYSGTGARPQWVGGGLGLGLEWLLNMVTAPSHNTKEEMCDDMETWMDFLSTLTLMKTYTGEMKVA